MGRVDEQLRFLQELHGAVGIRGFAGADKLLGLEQILGEFAAGVLVPEKLRVVKTLGELGMICSSFSEIAGFWSFTKPCAARTIDA